jgi:YbbR domain-containing protein
MIEKITHNWLWKVVALLVAFILWLVVVNYDDPIERKPFYNVVVEKRNADAITSQGQAIEYKEGEVISVVISGKRSLIDRMTSADIIAYVDLSKVSITNTVDIEFEISDKLEVLEKKPNNMQISLEQVKTELRDVVVSYVGELEKDYVRLNPVVTPSQIEITGPQSKLAMVAQISVPIRVDNASNDVTVYVTPKLLDASGNEVTGLSVSNNQIQIKVPIQKIKTVPVVFQTTGTMNEGYRLLSMKLDMEQIVVRGEPDVLANFTKLVVPDIDLSLLTDETTTQSINLNQFLPAGINVYNSEAVTELKIEVAPLVLVEYSIIATDIIVKQLAEGLIFEFIDNVKYEFELKGVQKELDSLTVEDLLPSLNLKELGEGTHVIDLSLYVPTNFELMTDLPSIKIKLAKAVSTEQAPTE